MYLQILILYNLQNIMNNFLSKEVISQLLTQEKAEILNNNKFNEEQSFEILFGLQLLPTEKVKIFANHELNADKIRFIRRNCSNLNIEQIKILANSNFNLSQIEELYYAFEKGLNKEQIEVLSNDLDEYKMFFIRKGFEEGLTIEQAKNIIKKGHFSVKDVIEALKCNG